MVQLSLSPVVSQNLFSQNYLQDRLKEDKTWRDLKEHKGAFAEIKALYEREKGNFGQYNEAQLEDHFIKPILRILGHAFEVQAESGRSALTPDYAFFPDDGTRVEALKFKGDKSETQVKIITYLLGNQINEEEIRDRLVRENLWDLWIRIKAEVDDYGP